MTERQRMIEGKLYNPYKVEGNEWEKSRVVLEQFNQMPYQTQLLTKKRQGGEIGLFHCPVFYSLIPFNDVYTFL